MTPLSTLVRVVKEADLRSAVRLNAWVRIPQSTSYNFFIKLKQGGAAEAYPAHNRKVGGSKPLLASYRNILFEKYYLVSAYSDKIFLLMKKSTQNK